MNLRHKNSIKDNLLNFKIPRKFKISGNFHFKTNRILGYRLKLQKINN